MSFVAYQQQDQMDCGPTCIRMIAKNHGRSIPIEYIRELASMNRNGVSFAGIAEAAENLGFNTAGVKASFDVLKDEVPLPCIAHWRERHFVVVIAVSKDYIDVADPGFGKIRYSKKEFLQGWLNYSQCSAQCSAQSTTQSTTQSTVQNTDSSEEGTLLLFETTPYFFKKEYTDELRQTEIENATGVRFLLPYLTPYKKLYIQLIAGMAVGTICLTSFPFITQALVDYGVNYQNIDFVYLLLAAQLMLFFSQSAVDIVRSWILLHIGARINILLISDFLIKLMKLPISFFDSKTIGDLLQRVQDHDRIESFLSSTTLGVLFSTINILIFSIILAYFNTTVFLIFFSVTLIYIGWVILFMRQRRVLDYKRFDQASGNQSSMVQLLNGMQEIKLNNSERRRRWEWEAIQVKLYKISIKSLALFQYQTTGGNLINELKNIIITFISAKAVIDGQISLGTMLAIQYIIGQLNTPVNNFIAFIQSMQDAQISLDRLSEIHHQQEEHNTSLVEIDADADIKIEDKLSFRYGNSLTPLVLEDISLTIPNGKVTAIVGASGSGKTTLLKLLLKFYTPENGRIKIGTANLEDAHTREWRSKCGVVMQDGYLFADTIHRNITESDSDNRTNHLRLQKAIQIANLEEMIQSLPNGLNTRVGSSGIALSGGQIQRLLIARAVYKNPDFLFFDEATSALDAKNERIVIENLRRFYQNRTVLIIAHRLSTVKNADQIITLDSGRVAEHGTHQELISRQGIYYQLIKNQLELGA